MSLEKPNIWLCIITSENERENIDELTKDIWQNFDGICAVVHPDSKNPESREVSCLLEDRMKKGFIKKVEWLAHHGNSMNQWLFDKRIEQGDVCVIRDTLERLNPQFAQNLSFIIDELAKKNVWNIWSGGKLLAFRRWSNQQFFGGIHWGFSGYYNNSIDVKNISILYNDERQAAYSVRNEKRPREYQVIHEMKYLLDYGCNSNHLALYFSNPQELIQKENELYKFKSFLKKTCDVSSAFELRDYLTFHREIIKLGKEEWVPQLKEFMNFSRPSREAYRHWVEQVDFETMMGPDRDNYRII